VNLESKRPPGPLFRVGRDRDAWAVPDWAHPYIWRLLRFREGFADFAYL